MPATTQHIGSKQSSHALLITKGGKKRQILTTKLNEEYNTVSPQKDDRIFYPTLNTGFKYDGEQWVFYENDANL